MTAAISAQNVIEHYKTGDEIRWADELEFLWTKRRAHLLKLMDSVLEGGFREPITLGNDGRVWDGHHRLAVALALDVPIPVAIVPKGVLSASSHKEEK